MQMQVASAGSFTFTIADASDTALVRFQEAYD